MLQARESSPGGMQPQVQRGGLQVLLGKERDAGTGAQPCLESGLATGTVWAGASWPSYRRGQSRGGCSPSVLGTPNPGILFSVSGAEHPLFALTLVTDELLSWALFPLREHQGEQLCRDHLSLNYSLVTVSEVL